MPVLKREYLSSERHVMVAAEGTADLSALSEPAPAGKPRPPRAATIRYRDFRATAEGREYSLQVDGENESRLFLFFIGHPAFAARQLSFQDAPDLCFSLLRSDLSADPELLPGSRREPTSEELLDYHRSRLSPASGRRRRASVSPVPGAGAPYSPASR
jgi:hypothetical protein